MYKAINHGAGIAVVALLAGGSIALVSASGGCSSRGGTDASAVSRGADADAGPRDVVALGRLEPASGILTLSAAPGDRLESWDVAEGELVKAGRELGHLDSRTLRKLELDAAESQLREAQARRRAEESLADARISAARLAVEQADARQLEIAAQEARVTALQAALALDQKDLSRLAGLPDALVSPQQRERQQLLVTKAEAEVAAAESALESLKQAVRFAQSAAQADLQAAIAAKQQALSAVPIDSLSLQRDVAQRQLDQSTIIAPAAGTILKIHTRAGEAVGTKPLLQLADLDRMTCVVEVYETDVKRIEIGQRAVIRGAALPPPYDADGMAGTVSRVGNVIATPELQSLDPFARYDRHVVEVRIALEAAESAAAARLVNLQVEATFVAAGTQRDE